MRIDGVTPVPPVYSGHSAQENGKDSAPKSAAVVQDQVEVRQQPEAEAINVTVEMQPGNIVVYKFIDEANGQVIQQIPSEQMLNLAESVEHNGKPNKLK
jgi:uncharacterized FlaG/YvyC family protein